MQQCRDNYCAVMVSPPRGRASLYTLRGVRSVISTGNLHQSYVSVCQEDLASLEAAYMESVIGVPSSSVAPVAVSWVYDNASSISITPYLSESDEVQQLS